MKKGKQCLICGKSFSKPTRESYKQFSLRKHCSITCQAKARVGKPNPSSIGNKHRLGKKFSKETLEKMSKSHRGEKSPFWKGGVMANYPEKIRIRKSIEYRIWRKAVFERDNYTCIWCGERNGNGHTVVLNADHIKPFADYPELRFAIDNGRTLCIKCHKTTETYSGKGLRRK